MSDTLRKPQTGTLRLHEARAMTPPVDAGEALRRNLASVVFESITTADVGDIVGNLKKQAKGGDTKAARLLLDLITKAKPEKPEAPPARVERITIEKPVLVSSVANEPLRRLVALSLLINGTLSVTAIAALTGLSEGDVPALIDSEWFRASSSGITLMPEGRNAVS